MVETETRATEWDGVYAFQIASSDRLAGRLDHGRATGACSNAAGRYGRGCRCAGRYARRSARSSRTMARDRLPARAHRSGRGARPGDPRAHDGRTEGGSDHPGRHRQRHARGCAPLPPRLGPQRGQFGAGRRRSGSGGEMARTGRRVLRRLDGCRGGRARDPDRVGHRCGARPQQYHRRHDLSAQCRTGRDARSRTDRTYRTGHRGRDPGHRAGMDLRAYRGRPAGLSLGTGLRRLFLRSFAGRRLCRQHDPRPPGAAIDQPDPRRTVRRREHEALSRRRRDHRWPGPGRCGDLRTRAAADPRRTLYPGDRKRRRHDHDQLLELERGQAVRTSRAGDRRAQGPDEFRRHGDHRLECARPGRRVQQRQLPPGGRCGDRHVHGTRQLAHVLRQHAGTGARRHDRDGPARRRGCARIAAEGTARPVRDGQAVAARAVGRIRIAGGARSPRGRARGGAQVDGAAQEHRRAALAAGRPHPSGGRCGERHRAPVGWLDAELAGHRARKRPFPRGHLALVGDRTGRNGHRRQRPAFGRRHVHAAARCRDRDLRRNPLCGVSGGHRHAAIAPRTARTDRHHASAQGTGHTGRRGDDHRPSALCERGAQHRRCIRRRLAPRIGRRGGRRHAVCRCGRRTGIRIPGTAADCLAGDCTAWRGDAVPFRLRHALCRWTGGVDTASRRQRRHRRWRR